MVTKFPIATNENYQDRAGEWQTRTEWHDIVCWGNQAERAEKILQKGHLVYVEGRISKRKWQDKEGNDRYSTEIVSNVFKLLEKRDSGGQRSYNDDFPTAQDSFKTTNLSQSVPSDQNSPVNADDDLPF